MTPNGGVELDPWGANTARSSATVFQPQTFTGITDANGDQDVRARRYSPTGRFPQPDPSGGSYDFSNPQSLNRYAYVGNDPINFRDPSGMEMNSSFCGAESGWGECGSSGFWGSGSFAGNGWGHDPHPGRDIIRNAEPHVTKFSIDRDENVLNLYVEPSMFGNDDDNHLAAIDVADAVEAALQILAKGCWDESANFNQDVGIGDNKFANVRNADKYSKGWQWAPSSHNLNSTQSPTLYRYRIKVVDGKGNLDPYSTVVVNAAAGFDFVIKNYPGEGMAVTPNTASMPHITSSVAFEFDPNTNRRWAQMFLQYAPKCKK